MISAAMSRIRSVVLCLLALFPVVTSAVTVDGLYRVQVTVPDTSESAQQAAYSEGLRQVLMRVSGSREVLQSDQLGALLDNAESLVQAYQYQTSPDGADQLLLTFGPVGVNRALADLQVPVWGVNRPLTLSWIAVDSGRDRWIVTADDDALDEKGRWSRAFTEAASKRGLPLSLPPSSVRDSRDLVSEIRGQFMESLRSAAASYPHNLISVVNVSRRGSAWEARWRIDGPAFSDSGDVRDAASSEALATAVVDAWADLLAERYSVDAGKINDAQRVDLVIENVSSVETYGALKTALNQMSPVINAGPVEATDKEATMRVAFSGELALLKEYIALDSRFQPVEADEESSKQAQTAGTAMPGGSQRGSGVPEQKAATTTQSGDAANAGEAAGPSQSDQAAMPQYRPVDASQAESGAASEKDFESLYPVLRYRWVGDGSPVTGQVPDDK